MSTSDKNPDSSGISQAVVVPKSGKRISLVWIVPILAAVVGLGLAIKAVVDRGPEITLQFSSADGLEAGKTKIKFKDVEIGTVKAIALASDRKTVTVSAELVRSAASLMVDDTRFWVVRPRVGVGGISGLGTLLSGSYIGMDVGKASEPRHHFVGLEVPPIITSDIPGKEYVLRADDLGSLDVGSPIYLRRIQVGRVATYELDKDGRGVTLTVFVNAPYDKLVNPTTRFWHTSGIDLSMDDRGFKLGVESMTSLIMGGISFATNRRNMDVAAAPAKSSFILHRDQRTAMRTPDGEPESYVFIFSESIRGLRVGSSVDFRGLTIGDVTSIGMDQREDTGEIVMVVEADIYRERFKRRLVDTRKAGVDETERRAIMDHMVKGGLRAQLRSGSIVTGENFIALDFFPKAKAAKIDWSKPVPVVPTQPGKLATLEEDLAEVMAAMKTTLESTNKLVLRMDKEVTPEVASTLADVRRTLATADKLLASESPVQQELRETLREVSKAATALRQLADLLERQPESLIMGKKGDEQ